MARGERKHAREAVQDVLKEVQRMASEGQIDRQLAEQLVPQLAALAGQLR